MKINFENSWKKAVTELLGFSVMSFDIFGEKDIIISAYIAGFGVEITF